MTSFGIFPNIANASVENFCCCCPLSLSALAILSIKASSFSCALSRNKRTVLCSFAPAPPLAFFLEFFFTSFFPARLFGLGIIVLVPFLFLLLFLKNSDFGNATTLSSSSKPSALYVLLPDVPGVSLYFWARAATKISSSKASLSSKSLSISGELVTYKLLSSTCLGFTTSHLPKMLSISLKFFGISSVSLSVSLSSSSPPFPYPVVLSLSLTVLYFLVRFAILFLHCWADFSLLMFSCLHLSCSCLAIDCHSRELNDQ